MRSEVATLLAGAGAAVLILAGRWALLPEPPSRASVPRVESLEALSPWLAADTVRPRGDDVGVVRLVRDPFGATLRPAGAGEDGAERRGDGGWSVSAIMISGDRRLAIVDDRLVEAGDVLAGGGRLVQVARDHVVVLGPDGVRRRVPLNR